MPLNSGIQTNKILTNGDDAMMLEICGGILLHNRNHLLCLIVCDCMVYPESKFLLSKTNKWLHSFWVRRLIFLLHVNTQEIIKKFIEIHFCFGCMVWPWLHLFQHWTFVKYWWDASILTISSCIPESTMFAFLVHL